MAGPNNRAYAVATTEIGLAKETTIGTLPAAPTYMLPVKGPKYKPDQTYIPDETLQGSMVQIYDEVQSLRYDSHGWSAPPYLDSFPLLLMAELGSPDTKTTAMTSTTLAAAATAGATTVSITGVVAVGNWFTLGSAAAGTLETHQATAVTGAGPYTVTLNTPVDFPQASLSVVGGLTGHKFSLLNNTASLGDQPPSFSIWDNDGEEWRTISACQLDELNIKGNATGLLDYTCTLMGNPAALNATAPSVSYTGVQTPAPWSTAIAIGGSSSPTLTEWEISMKRATKPIPALTGTREYIQYFAGPLDVSYKVTFVEQSGSPYLANYLNATRQSFDLTTFDMLAGAALNIHSTTALFTTGEIDRGKEWVEVQCTVQPLPSTTDATAGGSSPLAISVANSVTTAY